MERRRIILSSLYSVKDRGNILLFSKKKIEIYKEKKYSNIQFRAVMRKRSKKLLFQKHEQLTGSYEENNPFGKHSKTFGYISPQAKKLIYTGTEYDHSGSTLGVRLAIPLSSLNHHD